MRKAGELYSQEVRKKGKGHGMGPPAPHFFMALLTSLTDEGSTIGAETLIFLKWVYEVLEAQAMEDICLFVRQCKTTNVYAKSKTKLVISVIEHPLRCWMNLNLDTLKADGNQQLHAERESCRHLSIRHAIRMAFAQMPAIRHLSGRAPQGAMEGLLQSCLN